MPKMYKKTIAERMSGKPGDILNAQKGSNGITMHKEVQKSLELLKSTKIKRSLGSAIYGR